MATKSTNQTRACLFVRRQPLLHHPFIFFLQMNLQSAIRDLPTALVKEIREYHDAPEEASLVCRDWRLTFRLPLLRKLKKRLKSQIKNCQYYIDFVPFHDWLRERNRMMIAYHRDKVNSLTEVIKRLQSWDH